MTASDLASIERLLSDFAWCADRGDGAGLAQLFVVDGVLHLGGREFVGRTAIARTARRVHAHLAGRRGMSGRICASCAERKTARA